MGTRGIRGWRDATSRFVGIEACPLTVGPVVLGVEAPGIGRLNGLGVRDRGVSSKEAPVGSSY